VNESEILDVLRGVVDPELGVNVVDLGLVYGVDVVDDTIQVRMTTTSIACPLAGHLAEAAESLLRARWPHARPRVEVVWEPPWGPERMSASARRQLGG
jgi:metal-sulfur cluster biosynthetic enzyme